MAQKSDRQQEAARLAAAGLSNRAIQARMGVSGRTVKNYLSATYHEAGLSNQPGLHPRVMLARMFWDAAVVSQSGTALPGHSGG